MGTRRPNKPFDWGDETFDDTDEVVARKRGCSPSAVMAERRRRGILRLIRTPAVDWGDEDFLGPDEVTAIKRGTTVLTAQRERLRRGIYRKHTPRALIEQAADAMRASKAAAAGGFFVTVRGLQVRCDSLEALDAIVRQYGSERGGSAAESPPPLPLQSVPMPIGAGVVKHLPQEKSKHQKCWHERCKRLAPILPSGMPASVCERHASEGTLFKWKQAAVAYGRPVIYADATSSAPRSPAAPAAPRVRRGAGHADPLGLCYVEGQGWRHAPEAAFIKQIYERAAAGETASAIADWLNAQGVRRPDQPSGGDLQWDYRKVHRLISSFLYCGGWWRRQEIPRIVSEELRQAALDALRQGITAKPSKLPKLPKPPKPPQTKVASVETKVSQAVNAQPLGGAVSLDDVLPIQIRWFWHNYVPAGMLTVLYGPPGAGKGTLTATLAAAATTGSRLPGDVSDRPAAGVLVVSAEDSLQQVLRPRMAAAGAALARVRAFGPDAGIKFPESLAEVEQVAREVGASLIVVDPLRAVVNGDSRRDVRNVLVSLEALAVRTGAAVLVVHHSAKANEASPLGSQDILGIPRSLLRVTAEGSEGVVTQAKTNIAPKVDLLHYKIVTRGGASAIEWRPPKEVAPVPIGKKGHALTVVDGGRGGDEERPQADDAVNDAAPSDPVGSELPATGTEVPKELGGLDPAAAEKSSPLAAKVEESRGHEGGLDPAAEAQECSTASTPVIRQLRGNSGVTPTEQESLRTGSNGPSSLVDDSVNDEEAPAESLTHEEIVDVLDVIADEALATESPSGFSELDPATPKRTYENDEDSGDVGEEVGGFDESGSAYVDLERSAKRSNALGRARQARARKSRALASATSLRWVPYKPSPDMELWRCIGCRVGVLGKQRAWHLERCATPPVGGVDAGFEYCPVPVQYPAPPKKQVKAQAKVEMPRRPASVPGRALPSCVYEEKSTPGRYFARVNVISYNSSDAAFSEGTTKLKRIGTFASVEEASAAVDKFYADRQAEYGNSSQESEDEDEGEKDGDV